MRLLDVIQQLEDLTDERCIYVEEHAPWTAEIAVALAGEDVSLSTSRVEVEGVAFVYFLEVTIAKQAIEVWKHQRPDRTPSDTDKAEAVIHKAEHDSWLPLPEWLE